MLEVSIPGRGTWKLEHLLLDVNGTLSLDGRLLPGVAERLGRLKQDLRVRLLTADTFGRGRTLSEELGVSLQKVTPPSEDHAKEAVVHELGPENVVAIGNGANDVRMLRAARLGIAVLGPEATASEAFQAADVLAPDILVALDLLLNPKRLIATLRR